MKEVILDSLKAGVWTAIFCGLMGLYNRAQADERTVEWRMLPELELQAVCSRQSIDFARLPVKTVSPIFSGCYADVVGKCVIYTRIVSPINNDYMMAVLGHELRHCFQGRFHD